MTPRDAESAQDSHEWLNRAQSNLLRAKTLVDGVFLEDLCFDAQQAAEKSVKAVMVARDIDFPFVHDLARLFTVLELDGVHIPPEIRKAERLTPFAVETRYPGAGEPVTETEYQEAVAVAEAVVTWASGLIEQSNSDQT